MIVRRLDANFDMTFGQGLGNYAQDAEAVAQNVRTRLQLLRGEWFLDTSSGVPYLQEIAVKPSNLPLAEAYIKACILGTDGVASLEDFQTVLNRDTRRLSIAAVVKTVYGTTANIQVTQ